MTNRKSQEHVYKNYYTSVFGKYYLRRQDKENENVLVHQLTEADWRRQLLGDLGHFQSYLYHGALQRPTKLQADIWNP